MNLLKTLNTVRRAGFQALTILGIASALGTGCTMYTSGGKLSMATLPTPEKVRPAIALKSAVVGPLHLAYTLQKSGCFSEVRVGSRSAGEMSLVASYNRSGRKNNTGAYNVLAAINLAMVLPIVEVAEETVKFTVMDSRGVKHVYEYSDNCITWTGLLVPAPVLTQTDQKAVERNNARKMCSHLLNDMQRDGLFAIHERASQ